MNRHSTSGIALPETLLVVVILFLVGFTAWFVVLVNNNASNSYESATKSSNSNVAIKKSKVSSVGEACTLNSTGHKGEMVVIAKGGYTFCVPNGWTLGYQDASSMEAGVDDLHYDANKTPVLQQSGGLDNNFPFTAFYSTDVEYDKNYRDRLADYALTPPPKLINGKNLKVSAYYHLTGTNDVVGAGIDYLPRGTKQYVYVIETTNDTINTTLQVSYHVEPSVVSVLSDVESLVASVRLP